MTPGRELEATSARMERVVGIVLRSGVIASSACLTVGLILELATPVARVVVSTAEYVSERDWRFAALTGIVLLELVASAIAALVFNRKP